jgi:host factor-I protein
VLVLSEASPPPGCTLFLSIVSVGRRGQVLCVSSVVSAHFFMQDQEAQKGDRQMENKPAQNIQDSFLNTARKEKTSITVYLLSGVKLTGRIRSFDKYSVVLETGNQEQLIFKHAISTVVMGKSAHYQEARPPRSTSVVQQPEPKPAQNASPAAPASSSGTEG